MPTALTPHALPLLYSYRRCPYAMRARMALLQARRSFRVFEIVLRDKPADMLAVSPKGTVPVLQLPDGTVLDESWDIMCWAWAFSDDAGWWSRAHTPGNMALLHTNDGPFKHHLDGYKYPERHADAPVVRETSRSEAVVMLGPLEARLQHAPFLGGPMPCATDLAIFPFVRQFAAVDPVWFAGQPLPAVQAWLAAWVASPLFAACMVKVPAQRAVDFPAL